LPPIINSASISGYDFNYGDQISFNWDIDPNNLSDLHVYLLSGNGNNYKEVSNKGSFIATLSSLDPMYSSLTNVTGDIYPEMLITYGGDTIDNSRNGTLRYYRSFRLGNVKVHQKINTPIITSSTVGDTTKSYGETITINWDVNPNNIGNIASVFLYSYVDDGNLYPLINVTKLPGLSGSIDVKIGSVSDSYVKVNNKVTNFKYRILAEANDVTAQGLDWLTDSPINWEINHFTASALSTVNVNPIYELPTFYLTTLVHAEISNLSNLWNAPVSFVLQYRDVPAGPTVVYAYTVNDAGIVNKENAITLNCGPGNDGHLCYFYKMITDPFFNNNNVTQLYLTRPVTYDVHIVATQQGNSLQDILDNKVPYRDITGSFTVPKYTN